MLETSFLKFKLLDEGGGVGSRWRDTPVGWHVITMEVIPDLGHSKMWKGNNWNQAFLHKNLAFINPEPLSNTLISNDRNGQYVLVSYRIFPRLHGQKTGVAVMAITSFSFTSLQLSNSAFLNPCLFCYMKKTPPKWVQQKFGFGFNNRKNHRVTRKTNRFLLSRLAGLGQPFYYSPHAGWTKLTYANKSLDCSVKAKPLALSMVHLL